MLVRIEISKVCKGRILYTDNKASRRSMWIHSTAWRCAEKINLRHLLRPTPEWTDTTLIPTLPVWSVAKDFVEPGVDMWTGAPAFSNAIILFTLKHLNILHPTFSAFKVQKCQEEMYRSKNIAFVMCTLGIKFGLKLRFLKTKTLPVLESFNIGEMSLDEMGIKRSRIKC